MSRLISGGAPARPKRFGMSEEQWSVAARELETLLCEAAARRRTVTYGEAARRAFGGRFSARSGALMALLAEVDARTEEARGVIIATLVVRADTGRPGEGYFAFARDEMGRDVTDREAFWRDEAARVWDEFAAEGPGA